MAVIVIPIAIGAAQAGVWAYRAYQVYRAARLAAAAANAAQALEELEAAQSAAKPDDKAGEKTDSQVKAGAAPSADCKDCNEDPNCDKWRQEIKKALYAVKQPKGAGGDGSGGGKGLAQMLCEWMHGTKAGGGDHSQSVDDALQRIDKNLEKLADKRKQFRCADSPELKKEAEKYKDALGQGNRDSIPHLPRADFKTFCYEQALALAQKFLGR
jgi:hypothetical protein